VRGEPDAAVISTGTLARVCPHRTAAVIASGSSGAAAAGGGGRDGAGEGLAA
jgi:hypothetical protein